MKKNFCLFLVSILFFACSTSDDLSAPSGSDSSLRSYSGIAGSGSNGSGNGNGTLGAGVLTAGEWNDLQNWSFWIKLMERKEFSPFIGYWKLDLVNRISVSVSNTEAKKVVDIPVALVTAGGTMLWESRTDHTGRAELWVNVTNSSGKISLDNLKIKINNQIIPDSIPLKRFEEGLNEVIIQTAQAPVKKLDVAFVVDATGSMGDEISYLKTELLDVINRVKKDNPNTQVNLGAVFYRDKGDDYLTKTSDLSTDISKTINFIKQQNAGGGGDFPEAVDAALHAAVNEMQWADKATARVLFLILDAPPHNKPDVITRIQEAIRKASQKGIKIIPVTASGIDKPTELLMRLMAITTNGSYVFITNHSGIGNNHLEPTVGAYQVEYLNNLMVRLLNKSVE